MSTIRITSHFYSIYLLGLDSAPRKFMGTAFPIAPNGGLMTCRHVTDVNKRNGENLGVWDKETRRMIPIDQIRYPERPNVDIAFLPNALQRAKEEYFPILSPERIMMGEDVYTFGYYQAGPAVDVGYFKGNIVTFRRPEKIPDLVSMSVSFAVLEGLSGSPLLTYHNGPKVVGLCYGNTQSRIVASEVLEYQDQELNHRETVHRIVELGQAYHASVLVAFLKRIEAPGYVVSSDRVPGV